jgi:thymidine kinase
MLHFVPDTCDPDCKLRRRYQNERRRAATTLGDIAGRITMLEAACSRCERCGRLPVRLIEQHAVSVGEAVRLSSLYSDKLVV